MTENIGEAPSIPLSNSDIDIIAVAINAKELARQELELKKQDSAERKALAAADRATKKALQAEQNAISRKLATEQNAFQKLQKESKKIELQLKVQQQKDSAAAAKLEKARTKELASRAAMEEASRVEAQRVRKEAIEIWGGRSDSINSKARTLTETSFRTWSQ